MPGRHSPIQLGCMQATSLATPAAIVNDVWFPPDFVLPAHTHERTIFGVMLDGSFDTLIAGRQLGCRAETVWIEPRGERHANNFGVRGARVLAIEPDPARDDLFGPLMPLLDDARLIHTAGLRAHARQLAFELRSREPLTSLAIDALVLLLMVSAARLRFERKHNGAPPPWLLRARDALHEYFSRPPSIAELAAIAGVSASHLAHSFRKHFRVTPGEYVRHVRVHWAAQQLALTDRPLSQIAHSAGYSDQSHFTRELRRVFGSAPGSYRASRRH